MAEGSQKFQWNLYPGVERKCWECDRPLLVKDVAEERTVYPGRRYQFRCTTCRDAAVAKRVDEARKFLGLQDKV